MLRSARQSPYGRRLITVALALALDRLWGEPPAAWHPVVAMGRGIAAMERRAAQLPPLAQLAYGAAIALGGSLACAAAAGLVLAATRGSPPLLRTVLHALLLKSCFALRALDDAAAAVAEALRGDDLPLARARLRALVGRDTASLDAPLLAAAAVESVAENLSDSFVAPLTWYWLLDLPGALAYRFANTCDAMLGYRGRYEYLGKASARLDDLLNWLPARLTALLLVCACPLARASARRAWHVMCRDHARTASPNAGWPMSAAAGALGVRLEKVGYYVLGDGPAPAGASAIYRAMRLARVAAALTLAGYAGWYLVRRTDAAPA